MVGGCPCVRKVSIVALSTFGSMMESTNTSQHFSYHHFMSIIVHLLGKPMALSPESLELHLWVNGVVCRVVHPLGRTYVLHDVFNCGHFVLTSSLFLYYLSLGAGTVLL